MGLGPSRLGLFGRAFVVTFIELYAGVYQVQGWLET